MNIEPFKGCCGAAVIYNMGDAQRRESGHYSNDEQFVSALRIAEQGVKNLGRTMSLVILAPGQEQWHKTMVGQGYQSVFQCPNYKHGDRTDNLFLFVKDLNKKVTVEATKPKPDKVVAVEGGAPNEEIGAVTYDGRRFAIMRHRVHPYNNRDRAENGRMGYRIRKDR